MKTRFCECCGVKMTRCPHCDMNMQELPALREGQGYWCGACGTVLTVAPDEQETTCTPETTMQVAKVWEENEDVRRALREGKVTLRFLPHEVYRRHFYTKVTS